MSFQYSNKNWIWIFLCIVFSIWSYFKKCNLWNLKSLVALNTASGALLEPEIEKLAFEQPLNHLANIISPLIHYLIKPNQM